jgi:tRNA U34 5-methylaminomethyl-2-thiouridine-forming methyltransferase MnmC
MADLSSGVAYPSGAPGRSVMFDSVIGRPLDEPTREYMHQVQAAFDAAYDSCAGGAVADARDQLLRELAARGLEPAEDDPDWQAYAEAIASRSRIRTRKVPPPG